VLTPPEADELAGHGRGGAVQSSGPTSIAPVPAPFFSRSPVGGAGSAGEVRVLESGRDSWEVLRECGLAPEELADLAREGVVGGIKVMRDKAKL
jgi:hypothetical protein